MMAGAFAVFAQDPTGGEIEDIVIEKYIDKQIILPKGNRNFQKIAPRPAEPLDPPITYDFRTLRFTAPDFNPVIKPLRLKQEELSRIYGGYVSAGFGNYNAPFLRGAINTKRDAEKLFSADFLHHSFGKGPVDGKNSGSGITLVNASATGMGTKFTAEGALRFENQFTHFYGYRPTGIEIDRENIRQEFNIIGLSGIIRNTKPSDFDFKLKGDFSYLDDRYFASESEAGVQFHSSYKIDDDKALLFKGDYTLVARKDSMREAKPRHLFRIAPAYQWIILEKLKLTAGVNAVIENDTIGSAKTVHIYPDVWLHYPATPSIEAYAGLTGDFEKVSLHTLAHENLWVNSNINIFHTNKAFELKVGLRGKAGRKIQFHAGTSVTQFRHLYFFENAVTDRAKFNVTYDNALRLNFFGELGFTHSETAQISLRGDYYSYSTSRIDHPWHRPQNRVGIYSNFKALDKMLITVSFISQGGAKAFDYETNRVVDIPAALDLNAKVRYFLSKPFSIFVEGNNLLNRKYPLYLHYPSRGVQVCAGASWSF
jgi:hypothetical protein